MKGTLTLRFYSDTCFSAPGSSDPGVDTQIAVDDLGMPMVSGKTLHGLLRDTWLTAYPYLDPDMRLGNLLFGTPKTHSTAEQALLRIGDGRWDASAQRWVRWARRRRENPLPVAALRSAFLAKRVLTAQERSTGAPKQDTLRFVNVVPAHTELYADVSTARALSTEEREFLDTVLRLTRHVGHGRNRGLGHVGLIVNWEIPSSQMAETDHFSESNAQADGTGAATFYYPYQITLTAPCLLSRTVLDPNSRASKQHIPGASVRGAMASALIRAGHPEWIPDVILSGNVRFLNAYRNVEYGGNVVRSLPTPITWQRNKDALREDDCASGNEPQDALMPLFVDAREVLPGKQTQRLKGLYHAPLGANHYQSPEIRMRVTTHQTRDRTSGVAKKGESTVFVYEALEASQTFQGYMAVAGAALPLAERLMALLEAEPLWLGRSARSGYGGNARLAFLQREQQRIRETREGGRRLVAIENCEHFVVLLTSDALLRDPDTGQHDPYQLGRAVQERFGNRADVLTACVETGRLHGYNRLWRSELPVVPCAAAGSVVLLKSNTQLPAAELRKLQSCPLGECITEGCGCFLVTPATKGDPRLSLLPANVAHPHQPDGNQADLAEGANAFMEMAQRRLYAERIRLLYGNEALKLANEAVHLPSASLLQRLRRPLHEAGRDWKSAYQDWFGEKKDYRLKDTAMKPLKKCTIDRESLCDFLAKASQAGWLPPMDFPDGEERCTFQFVSDSLSERLWDDEKSRAALYFLDTLLGRLAKCARQKERIQVAVGTNE